MPSRHGNPTWALLTVDIVEYLLGVYLGLYLFWSEYLFDDTILVNQICGAKRTYGTAPAGHLLAPATESLLQRGLCVGNQREIETVCVGKLFLRKDKARKQLGLGAAGADDDIEKQIIGSDTNKRVNAGLLTYPTLMAVDILIQKAHKVPVGKDQEQHLELTRRFARRFNSFYGVDLFPEPENFNFGDHAVKVPGLDGSGKMGKSEGNCVYLIDEEKVLRKKVMRAVTDEGPKEPNQPISQPVENLLTLMELTSAPEIVQSYRDAYADCSIRYGDMKKQLAEDILKVTTPIRERYHDIRNDEAYISRVVRQGAERARERAAKTLEEVRQVMGIRKF